MAVLLPDLAVLAMDDQFAVLIFRQEATLSDGFLLCFVGRAGAPADLTSPSVSAGDYVYVWHRNLLRVVGRSDTQRIAAPAWPRRGSGAGDQAEAVRESRLRLAVFQRPDV